MARYTPGEEFTKRVDKARSMYQRYNQTGLLRDISESSGILSGNLCNIFKGRRGCTPETLSKIEKAMDAWVDAHKNEYPEGHKKYSKYVVEREKLGVD